MLCISYFIKIYAVLLKLKQNTIVTHCSHNQNMIMCIQEIILVPGTMKYDRTFFCNW